MSGTPSEVILSKRPAQYLEQGLSGCGGCTAKGILSAYAQDSRENPFAYYPLHCPLFSSPKRWAQVLREHGLEAEVGTVKGLAEEVRLNVLRDLLALDTPVMLHIGNGYAKDGSWNPIKWQLIAHWISAWGYSDREKVFYVYDSCVPPDRYDDIPIGNVKRTYEQILRDWCGGFPWWWRNQYVKVLNQRAYVYRTPSEPPDFYETAL